MRKQNHDDLAGRQAAASEAKANLLKSHKTAQEAAEPARLARQKERVAAAAARDERQAERTRVKAEERERVRADEALSRSARDDVMGNPTHSTADADASSIERGRAEAEPEVARNQAKKRSVSTDQEAAMQKAERDRRYANRKSSQRK
jgi:hypothetical protein